MRLRLARLAVFCAVVHLLLGLPAAAASVPPLKAGAVQDESSRPLPAAEKKALEDAIRANSGSEQYKILLIDSARPAELTDFLDQVWAEWKLPENTVLLVVATGDNHQIRFYLGNEVARTWGVSVDFMVGAIRSSYAGPAREGRLADALGALVAEVHRQVVAGGGQAAPPKPDNAAGGAGFRLPDFRVDLMHPALPWFLGLTGAGLIALAVIGYVRRLRRWNAYLQARLDRVLTQKTVEDAAGRSRQ